MTFLVLIAAFVGCSCLLVPLVLLAAFALFDRDQTGPAVGDGARDAVTRSGG